MNSQESRESYIISLYQRINPDEVVNRETRINNATIAAICAYDGGAYQRVSTWLEKKAYEKIQTFQEMTEAEDVLKECFNLMKSRNAKYGDSWKVLTLTSAANLIEMKMHRIARMDSENLDPKIKDEFMDTINYAVFALMKIK